MFIPAAHIIMYLSYWMQIILVVQMNADHRCTQERVDNRVSSCRFSTGAHPGVRGAFNLHCSSAMRVSNRLSMHLPYISCKTRWRVDFESKNWFSTYLYTPGLTCTHLDTPGHTWTHLYSPVFTWAHLDSPGYSQSQASPRTLYTV